LIIKNCASLSSKGSNSFSSKSVTQAYNSWNTGFTCVASDFVSLDYTQMLNLRQADGSLPEIPLLHLTPTSGLIDKGTNVGFAYYGLAPDLGAYEYNPNLTAIPTVEASDVSVYYSSVNHSISISGSISNVEVYLLSGQRIFTQHVSVENINIPVNTLSKGLYLVRVISQNGVSSTKKILIN